MSENPQETYQANLNFLDFEQPIAELEAKIEEPKKKAIINSLIRPSTFSNILEKKRLEKSFTD